MPDMSPARPEGDMDVGDQAVPPGDGANSTPVAQGKRRRRLRRAPVDIERQCAVPFPDGRQCGAALTCKRHSMSAKRSVAGRSAPFDLLLAAFQVAARNNSTGSV